MKKLLTTLLISTITLGASIQVATCEAQANEFRHGFVQTKELGNNYISGESFTTPYYKITPLYPEEVEPNSEFIIYYNVEELQKSELYTVQVFATIENGKFKTANPFPTDLTESRINFLDTDRTKQFKVLAYSGESGKVKISGKFVSVADDLEEPEVNYNLVIDIKDLALAKAKEAAKAEINGLPNLTEEEKAAFSKQVDEAKDIPTVDKIVEAAKDKDKENGVAALAKAKEAAKAEINGLPNLTEEEKAAFSKQVDEAKDIPTVDKIVEAAKDKDKENGVAALAKAKEAAKAEINGLPNLTEEEKAAFSKQVDEAKDIPTVDKIVEAAKDKDKENGVAALAKAKEAAKAEINGLPNLTEEEKAAFSKQVDEAKDIPTVDKIVEAAKDKDKENGVAALAKAKEAAKAEINGLPNLTEEEKAAFSKQVDEAKDIPTVDKIVEAAKDKDKENGVAALAKAKEAAKAEIKGLPNLAEEEKAAFSKQVDEAKDIPTVDKIVEAAKDKDKENGVAALAKAKEAAKAEIKGLPNLTEEEKAAFNKQVDEAKTTTEVDSIIKKAKKVNDSYILGDINNDGRISLLDLAIMKNYLDQKYLPNGIDEKDIQQRGDMNKDKKISLIDLALLKHALDKQ